MEFIIFFSIFILVACLIATIFLIFHYIWKSKYAYRWSLHLKTAMSILTIACAALLVLIVIGLSSIRIPDESDNIPSSTVTTTTTTSSY